VYPIPGLIFIILRGLTTKPQARTHSVCFLFSSPCLLTDKMTLLSQRNVSIQHQQTKIVTATIVATIHSVIKLKLSNNNSGLLRLSTKRIVATKSFYQHCRLGCFVPRSVFIPLGCRRFWSRLLFGGTLRPKSKRSQLVIVTLDQVTCSFRPLPLHTSSRD